MQEYWQNYINGRWVDGGSGRLAVTNPGTGEELAELRIAIAERAVRLFGGCGYVHRCGGAEARIGRDAGAAVHARRILRLLL